MSVALSYGNNIICFGNVAISAGVLTPTADPLNPLNLPPYTIRVKLEDPSYDCASKGYSGTWTRVDDQGTWDITYSSDNWSKLLRNTIGLWGDSKVHGILGMNSTNVTNFERFDDCAQKYLTGSLPVFDTTKFTDVTNAFYQGWYLTGGFVELYNQMANQANPPTAHGGCFRSCGERTTASADLAQVPSDWK